jgi:hypothetical protein
LITAKSDFSRGWCVFRGLTESQAVDARLGSREVRRATEHGYQRIFMVTDLAAGPA